MLDHCATLLCEARHEAFVLHLLDLPLGEWEQVDALARASGLTFEEIAPTIFAAWLDLPAEEHEAGFVFILFHDFELGETMTATYNRERLWAKHRGAKSTGAGMLPRRVEG